MKLQVIFLSLAFSLCLTLQSCVNSANADNSATTEKISAPATAKWTNIEKAADLSASNDKMILVDIYTDWCKWCKVMDEKTFANAEVKTYLTENFNLAKLNAEDKNEIQFNGKAYQFVSAGKRGINQLANEMMDGRPTFPSVAVFDSKLNKLKVIRGFKSPEDLLAMLREI